MNPLVRKLSHAVLIAVFSVAAIATVTANTGAPANSAKLMTATFDPRPVAKIDAGDFHFRPGQTAPVHTHDAPAVGYVARGSIIYQVEGEAPRVLRAGDVFYEPAGPRILRFDNASATDEAVFVDFNLQCVGEPFIVFPTPPAEAIDRRTLPSVDIGGRTVGQVDAFATDLRRRGRMELKTHVPTLGIVAAGIVEIRIAGRVPRRVAAGKTFSIPAGTVAAEIVNASAEIPARVITYRLR
jgi:quercetin dioxygenase-like cupin family protein